MLHSTSLRDTPRRLSSATGKYGDQSSTNSTPSPGRRSTISGMQISPCSKTTAIPSCYHKPSNPRLKNSPSQSSSASTHRDNTSYRRSITPSKSLHIKILLIRLLPPELVLPILCLASIYHRTSFIRTRVPLSYRERQIRTPSKIFQCVPPTLHLISSPHSISGARDHPLHSVRFYLRFCPAKLPNASVSFHARLVRDKKIVEGSDTVLFEPAMDGNVQSRSVVLAGASCMLKMASAGDQIGLWVMADGGLYGDWLHIPGHKMRTLVEVREASIECFCSW